MEQKISQSKPPITEVSTSNFIHISEDAWALGTQKSFEIAAHLVEKLLTSDRRPQPQQLLDANILCGPNTLSRQFHGTLRQLKFKQNAVLLSRKMRARPGRVTLERYNILPTEEGTRFRERTVLLEANIRHMLQTRALDNKPVHTN